MTAHLRTPLYALLLSLGMAFVVLSERALTQTIGEPVHFTAAVVDINTGRTGRLEVSVDRWSTADERQNVITTSLKEGQDVLLEVLRDFKPVGRIYSPGSIGYDVRFSQQRELPDGGREIILATDRPMSFWELVNQPKSSDYPFTWVQFRMRPDGRGEGELAVAARVTGDEANRLLEVEHYTLQPVRLQNVKSMPRDD